MLPGKLGVVMINVSNMERSVAFYRDSLGLKPDIAERAPCHRHLTGFERNQSFRAGRPVSVLQCSRNAPQ